MSMAETTSTRGDIGTVDPTVQYSLSCQLDYDQGANMYICIRAVSTCATSASSRTISVALFQLCPVMLCCSLVHRKSSLCSNAIWNCRHVHLPSDFYQCLHLFVVDGGLPRYKFWDMDMDIIDSLCFRRTCHSVM